MQERTSAFGASLLLVEDDPINADIASRILAKMGLGVTVAENGLAAIESWSGQDFDLVLMDCEMAEMDGFEATRRIRALEAPKAGARTPIVALTAHSAADIREKCLLAGMDDVLVKPFKDRQVAELLKRWTASSEVVAQSPVPPTSSAKSATAIDRSAFDQVGAFQGKDGSRLLRMLAGRFAETAPRQLRSMRENHEAGLSEEVRRIAHTLKSSSAALGATFVSRTCAEIERHAGDPGRLTPFLSALEDELPSAVRDLTDIVRDRDEQAHAHD